MRHLAPAAARPRRPRPARAPRFAAAAIAAALGACDREPAAAGRAPPPPLPSPPAAPTPARPAVAAPPAPAPAPAPRAAIGSAAAPRAYPAIRCAECHNQMHEEWARSGHARAATSPLYARMREHAGPAGAECAACHAPLAPHVGATDPAAREGVTCEVCHSLREVAPRRAGAGFALALGRTKYGPLCDAKDHYFHRMGCSPLHTSAELCAACHHYFRPLPAGGELPVLTEYADWSEGPYQARPCQSCHMPGARAEVADGAGERPDVAHHGWLGARGDLRHRALTATATLAVVGAELRVVVHVVNSGAGHPVPTGLPERRIVVRATARTPAGAPHATVERELGRVLVDATGQPAPFYAATRVAADDRIAPKQARDIALALALAPGGSLALEVAWRPIAAPVRARVPLPAAADLPLLAATVAVPPARPGRPLGVPRALRLERVRP